MGKPDVVNPQNVICNATKWPRVHARIMEKRLVVFRIHRKTFRKILQDLGGME
ncbi:hypothetical protein DESME_02095 [Desulfitobacterium metallireducens DSM 15288]|uniref:Uncharacterized protein n=1 Tax=Desulfitobacterium metallireducens DSM 15288 TaxID=871968 RepID=W0EH61_9FIRM|nr:hypothetical protein DESME_02095 [Desulfitobacterium metallireducens DSM 15288]